MLNITVRSSSGHDVAFDIPVLHARHIGDASTSSVSMPNDRHEKRTISIPQLEGCEAPYTRLVRSLCLSIGPGGTPQTYWLVCENPTGQSNPLRRIQNIIKTCRPYELCVTKVVGGETQANCVSQIDWRLIQTARMGGVTPAFYASHILTLPDRNALDHTGLVATLVAHNDITKTVVADRILLQAVSAVSKVEPVNGLSLYAAPTAGMWLGSWLMIVQ